MAVGKCTDGFCRMAVVVLTAVIVVATGVSFAQQPPRETPDASDQNPAAEQTGQPPTGFQPGQFPPGFQPGQFPPGFDPSQFPQFQPGQFPGRGGQRGQFPFPGQGRRGGRGGFQFPGFGQPAGPPTLEDVTAPEGFEVTLFGIPPEVNYPVCVITAPGGEVFVGVDEQGSIGTGEGEGKVIRCVDTDGDGKADDVTVVAKLPHPRGLVYSAGDLWVSHPPLVSVIRDADSPGAEGRIETLITGTTTEQIDLRGGDHTTNGIRMGVDGWIYMAVGDYGVKEAVGKDGSKVVLRGGGIVRFRPDGTEMEVFASGTRNIFDFAIDPYMNVFTRDNTNDGGGWDVRFFHVMQSADYGYTRLYANFIDEVMPALGVFGNGSGTGMLYLENPRWPAPFNGSVLSGDWGRSEFYWNDLKPNGATFDLVQNPFITIPRSTGMDVDAAGRLYLASWKGGERSMFIGPDVGFIARITPPDFEPREFPNLREASLEQLLANLREPQNVLRFHTQREILRRGSSDESIAAMQTLAADADAPLYSRAIAIFTLKQLAGADSQAALLELAKDDAVREFALKALTDRKTQLEGMAAVPFVDALTDPSPRVRAQAVISLGRLGDVSVAENLIPLTTRAEDSPGPSAEPLAEQPDPGRVIPHLAMQALISLNAVDAALAAVDGPHSEGALRVLRKIHSTEVVDGLLEKLGAARDEQLRRGILTALIRLYNKEADYEGSWWGIRPDNTGPYWDFVQWDQSERIAAVITTAVLDGDQESAEYLQRQLARHQVSLEGLPNLNDLAQRQADHASPIEVPKADPNNPNQIGNIAYEAAAARALATSGDAARGKELFAAQNCRSCHTDADGQVPKGPHLVDIGKRYSAAELVESILKPSEKIAQGYESYNFVTIDGRVFSGFIVGQSANAIQIRETTGVPTRLENVAIETRLRQEQSMMPEGIVGNLTPEELANLIAYLQSL